MRLARLARAINQNVKVDLRCLSIIAAAAIGLYSFAAMADSPTPNASGIEGVVSVSPSRPGAIRKDGPTKAPAGNLEFVVRADDVRVTSFTTDGEGRFRVALPPGHYTILREDPGARIGHWQFEADVTPGAITHVEWTGNGGMR